MAELAKQSLVGAAIDNSDRLLPSLTQLAAASGTGITLELERLSVPDAKHLGIHPARLWLGWGDWNVIAVVSSQRLDEVYLAAARCGATITIIGTVHENPGVYLAKQNRLMSAP